MPPRWTDALPDWLTRPGARERSILLSLVVLAGGLWGFAELADTVLEGSTQSLDERLLLALRAEGDPTDPIGPPALEEIGRDITALGGVAVLLLLSLGTTGLLFLLKKPKLALFLGVASGGGIALSLLLKEVFARPRPDLVPHDSFVYTSSFPSGHSMMAAVVYLTLAALVASATVHPRVKRYLLGVAVLVTIAVGVSRVYVGVHWPTDVLAGWLAGALWALLCWQVVRVLQRRGQVEGEGVEPEVEAEAGRSPLKTA